MKHKTKFSPPPSPPPSRGRVWEGVKKGNPYTIKVLAFLCNWAPWSCYTGMGDLEMPIPGEVNVIRVMCASRVNTALLLKAFEKGADGVLIIGCRTDNCQNGTGPEMALKNIDHTCEILNLLGLKKERLQFKYYLAHESEKLSSDLHEFVERIAGLGKSPIVGDHGNV